MAFKVGDRVEVPWDGDTRDTTTRPATVIAVNGAYFTVVFDDGEESPYAWVVDDGVIPIDEYGARCARDAQAGNYGDRRYWDYLQASSVEHYEKGVIDAFTQTLSEALKGNDGD